MSAVSQPGCWQKQHCVMHQPLLFPETDYQSELIARTECFFMRNGGLEVKLYPFLIISAAALMISWKTEINITRDFKLSCVVAAIKEQSHCNPSCRKRRLKWVPSAWGYSWATLSPGVINTEAWSSRSGVGRWTNNTAL
jgi:hypothetical protein